MTMPADKDVDRIRERAHELWQQDGCPDGRSLEYWLRAEADLAGTADAAAGAALEPAPSAMDEPIAAPARARRQAKLKAAAIVAEAPAPAREPPAARKATRRKQG